MTKKQAQEMLKLLREIKQTLETLRVPQYTYTPSVTSVPPYVPPFTYSSDSWGKPSENGESFYRSSS